MKNTQHYRSMSVSFSLFLISCCCCAIGISRATEFIVDSEHEPKGSTLYDKSRQKSTATIHHSRHIGVVSQNILALCSTATRRPSNGLTRVIRAIQNGQLLRCIAIDSTIVIRRTYQSYWTESNAI